MVTIEPRPGGVLICDGGTCREARMSHRELLDLARRAAEAAGEMIKEEIAVAPGNRDFTRRR